MGEEVKIIEQFNKGVEIMYKNKTEMNGLYIKKWPTVHHWYLRESMRKDVIIGRKGRNYIILQSIRKKELTITLGIQPREKINPRIHRKEEEIKIRAEVIENLFNEIIKKNSQVLDKEKDP